MAAQKNRWLVAVGVIIPVIALVGVIFAVIEDWRVGHGEIGMHGMIALAGAGIFSLALTVALVALMIHSHRSGRDDQTGAPDDEQDRQRRGPDLTT